MKTQTQNIKYFIYCRKSSDSEDRQIQSIPDQIRELKKIAEENKLDVVEVLYESKSAKAPGREVFTKMIERITKGEATGIIAWKLNRLARNPIDGGTISWMIQQGIIKHIQTQGRSYYPEDNVLMMAVELGMANQYVRDLSVDTKRGIRTREESGLPSGVASIGFLNDMSAEPGSRRWLVDKTRFPIIKQLLTLYATGRYSMRQITEIANEEMGLRTPIRKRQGGKKVTLSYVADTILKNTVYAGFFFTKDGRRHELDKVLPRMITEEQYWNNQRIMGKKGRPRPSVNIKSFAYIGPTKCGGCGGSVTAEHKHQLICPNCKSKFAYSNKTNCPRCELKIEDMENPKYLHYVYYHCTKRKDPKCTEGSVEENEMDKHVSNYFQKNLEISSALSDWCIKYLDELELQNKQNKFEIRESLELEKGAKGKEYEELIKMKMKGLIEEDDFTRMKTSIKADLERIDLGLSNLGESGDNSLDRAKKAFTLSVGIAEIFKNGNFEEKSEALSETGSNLTIKDKKLNISNEKLFSIIMNGLLEAKTKNTQFEPENIQDTSSRNEVFADVCPIMLRG